MKKFEFLKLKSIHHAIIVIQILERVCNVAFTASDLYTALLTALRLFKCKAENVTLYTLSKI